MMLTWYGPLSLKSVPSDFKSFQPLCQPAVYLRYRWNEGQVYCRFGMTKNLAQSLSPLIFGCSLRPPGASALFQFWSKDAAATIQGVIDEALQTRILYAFEPDETVRKELITTITSRLKRRKTILAQVAGSVILEGRIPANSEVQDYDITHAGFNIYPLATQGTVPEELLALFAYSEKP